MFWYFLRHIRYKSDCLASVEEMNQNYEGFHRLDRSSSPSLMNDVSAVSVTLPCRLDIKQDLKLAAIFTICSEVSTRCPDRHKATGPCLVYQKHLAAKIVFFFINQEWQERRDWSCPIWSPWTGTVWILSCFWQIGLWTLKHNRPDYNPGLPHGPSHIYTTGSSSWGSWLPRLVPRWLSG